MRLYSYSGVCNVHGAFYCKNILLLIGKKTHTNHLKRECLPKKQLQFSKQDIIKFKFFPDLKELIEFLLCCIEIMLTKIFFLYNNTNAFLFYHLHRVYMIVQYSWYMIDYLYMINLISLNDQHWSFHIIRVYTRLHDYITIQVSMRICYSCIVCIHQVIQYLNGKYSKGFPMGAIKPIAVCCTYCWNKVSADCACFGHTQWNVTFVLKTFSVIKRYYVATITI